MAHGNLEIRNAVSKFDLQLVLEPWLALAIDREEQCSGPITQQASTASLAGMLVDCNQRYAWPVHNNN